MIEKLIINAMLSWQAFFGTFAVLWLLLYYLVYYPLFTLVTFMTMRLNQRVLLTNGYPPPHCDVMGNINEYEEQIGTDIKIDPKHFQDH